MLLKIVIFSSQYFLSIIVLLFSFYDSLLLFFLVSSLIFYGFYFLHNFSIISNSVISRSDLQTWSQLSLNELFDRSEFLLARKQKLFKQFPDKKTLPASTTSWSTFFSFHNFFTFDFIRYTWTKKNHTRFRTKNNTNCTRKKKKCSVVDFLYYFTFCWTKSQTKNILRKV